MPDVCFRQASLVIRLPEGLHLRPLTQVSRLAQSFSSEVILRKGERVADAKRPLELMALAAMCGERLDLEVRGIDADAAAAAIIRLFEADFADGA